MTLQNRKHNNPVTDKVMKTGFCLIYIKANAKHLRFYLDGVLEVNSNVCDFLLSFTDPSSAADVCDLAHSSPSVLLFAQGPEMSYTAYHITCKY